MKHFSYTLKWLLTVVVITAMVQLSYGQARPDGFVKLKNNESGLFLATNGQKTKGSTLIRKDNIGKGGHWVFIKKGKYFKILNRDSGMWVAAMGGTNGAAIKQTNTPGNGALWEIIVGQGGTVQIKNKANSCFMANKQALSSGKPIYMVQKPGRGSYWKLVAVR